MNCFKKQRCAPITSLNNDVFVFEKVELYEPSHMPKIGWIHSCIMCASFTSKTLLFDRTHYLNKNYEFHTYLCKTCVGKISDNIRHYILFSKKASSMMRRYKIRNFNRNHLHEVEQSVLPDTSTS